MTTITITLDKKNEVFIKEQANAHKLSITEYLVNLAKSDKTKQNIKKDIIQMFEELNLVKEWKLKTNSINNLFNA